MFIGVALGVFVINFEHNSHTFFSVSVADLEQVKYILGMQKLEVYLEPSRTSMVEFFYENS